VRVTGKLGWITPSSAPPSSSSATRGRDGPAATPKLTIPAPSWSTTAAARPRSTRRLPDIDVFWEDLGAAYADEVRRLAALGCTYLQLDDTSLAYLNDPAQRAEIARRARTPSTSTRRTSVHQPGAAGQARRDDGHDTHVPRQLPLVLVAQGGYDFVADALFNELTVDGYFMEFDDERSGGFAPLRFVPKGKYVVLGLVTSKKGQLEAKDDLKRRIEEASKFVDIDQLCLSRSAASPPRWRATRCPGTSRSPSCASCGDRRRGLGTQ